MTTRLLIATATCRRRPVLCVLVALGAASAGASARDSAVDARGLSTNALTAGSPAFVDRQAKGAGFAVPRHVIAGGGGRSTGAVFAIAGTIGQPDVDPLQPSTGGSFSLTGGFWPGTLQPAPIGDVLFANGFEPNSP